MLLIKGDSGVDNSFFQQTCKHVADKLSTFLQKRAGDLSPRPFPLPEKGAFYGPAKCPEVFFTPLFTFI
jgi:hypothetical protein